MPETPEMKVEFVNDDVLVLDSTAGVVHRITGEQAEQVRDAADEVSRRNLIRMAIATGAGVVTLALPGAAAASSGGVGGAGGVTGGPGPVGTLDAPTGLSRTGVGNQSVSLSWNAVTNATSYTVYYWKGSDPESSLNVPSGTTATVTGLTNDQSYTFKVTASATNYTTSVASSTVTGTPHNLQAPGTPQTFAALASGTSVALSWAQGSGDAPDNYEVRYGTGSPYSTSAGTISGSTTSVTISGLTKGANYTFYIKATNAAGASSETSTSAYVPNLPAVPESFTVNDPSLFFINGVTLGVDSGYSTGDVRLVWVDPYVTASTGQATSFVVRWKLSSAASFADADVATGLTGVEAKRSGFIPGSEYDFQLKAVNADGESAWTSSVSKTIENPPNAPTNVNVSWTGSKARVTWSAPVGGGSVTSYYLYRWSAAHPWWQNGDWAQAFWQISDWGQFGVTSPFEQDLEAGETYVYYVSAENSDGNAGTASSEFYVPDPPGPPSVDASVSGTSATVSWSAGTGATPTSYTLEYKLASDTDASANYTVVSTNATSPYTIDNLAPGTSYVFRVTSVHADGTANAKTASKKILNPPGAPQNFTATSGNGQVTLTWSVPVTGGIYTSYNFSWGLAGGSLSTIGVAAGTTSRTVTGLTNGSTYEFRITAANADGNSSAATVYAIPSTTNQVTAAGAASVGPISSLTTGPTAASLTVTSDGSGYEYELDGASPVSVLAGSTTSIALSAATHTILVRGTVSGVESEATAVLTSVSKSGSTSATTTLYFPNTTNGVRTVGLTLRGAAGGNGAADNSQPGGSGGQPGQVTGTFAVSAGSSVQYAAGTGGGSGSYGGNAAGGSGGTNPLSGYAGGKGGNSGSSGASGSGGGGGAASVVIRTTGGTATTFVAAGSGGGGGGAGDGAGGTGQAFSDSDKTNSTSGGTGTQYSGDGAGSGGGGGGASGGNGGALSNTGAESYGLGGRAGSNAVASEAGLSAAAASGISAGSNGVVTLTYYEVTSISGRSVQQISESSLGASTPGSGSAPSATVSVSALSGNASALVSWTAVTGATDYLVYFRRNGTSTWGLAGTSSTTSLGVMGLRNNAKYDFAVRTRKGSNTSGLSSTESATPSASVTNTPVSAMTATTTLATVTLDNLDGCTYTYKVDSGSVTSATGLSSVTAALSGSTHTVDVTKTYFDGTASATTSKTVTLTRTTKSSGANSSDTYTVPANGPREMLVSLVGGKGGRGGNDGGSQGGNGGDPGEVAGVFTVQSGDTVTVCAGGGGANGGSNVNNSGGGSGGSNAYTGYDGAGGGNAGDDWFTTSGGGGGGGAASIVVRTRSASDTVLAVAGGSGGGGGAGSSGSGGAGTSGTANGSSKNGSNGTTQYGDGGGGGGGGGGAPGGAGGGITLGGDGPGSGGNRGGNDASGLDSTTTNSTKTGVSNGAAGTATITYYVPTVA